MKKSIWAKIFGWAQFGLTTATTIATTPGGLPHGAGGWLSLAASLLTAIGIHHASSTDGVQ